MINTPITIAVLLPNLQAGGTEKVITTFINRLSPAQYDIHVIHLAGDQPFFKLNSSIQQHTLPTTRLRYAALPLLCLLRQLQPQLILSTLGFTPLLLCLAWLLPSSVKIIARSSHLPTHNGWWRRIGYTILYRRLQSLLVQSDSMKHFWQAHFPTLAHKVVTLYNPVDYPFIQQQRRKIPDYPIPKHPILITIGRLVPVKGHQRILEALAELSFHFTYWIIGRNTQEMQQQLSTFIEQSDLRKKVVFLGEQANPYQFLHHATLYLQGSYTEGYPNAMLEAQACGVPCIAFDIGGGTSEAIQEGFNGFLVPNNHIRRFATTIEQALGSTFDTKAIQTHILHKHCLGAKTEQFTQILQQIHLHSSL